MSSDTGRDDDRPVAAGPDEDLRGVVDDEPGPDEEPGTGELGGDDLLEQGATAGGGHVGADLDWEPTDSDDPDGGSGRTGGDPGY